VRLVLVTVAVSAAALMSALPAAAKPPRDFVGIVAEDVFAGDDAYRQQTLSVHRRLGVQLIRQTFDWSTIETSPGQYNFAAYDGYMAQVARHGIRVVPVLFRPPAFLASGVQTTSATFPPRKFSDMGRFGAAIARRYGPHGSFWRSHRKLRRVPITSYQVWNEPNLPIYWPSGPNAKAYARLLKATGRGIKRADRHARILTAGMPESKYPGAVPLLKYLSGLYRAGAKHAFDAVSINTYANNAGELIKLLRSVRTTMNRHGDRSGHIWASEFGWADSGPKNRFLVGPKAQARNISKSIRAMGANKRRLKLSGFVYWNWKDAPPYRPGFDFWGLHAGLLQQDGHQKPAFNAFAQAVKKLK
jgi:hypothetical protein